jgi:hypothetical protein
MFCVACVAVALFRGFGFTEGGTVSDLMPGLRERSAKVESQVKDGVKKVGIPEGGSGPVAPAPGATVDKPVGPTHY